MVISFFFHSLAINEQTLQYCRANNAEWNRTLRTAARGVNRVIFCEGRYAGMASDVFFL